MSDAREPDPASAPADDPNALPAPGVSGCIGMAITGTLLVGLWLAVTFFIYAWLGKEAAAVAFFGPVLLIALGMQFSKPVDGGGKGLPKS